MALGDVSNVLDCVDGVVGSLHEPWPLRLLQSRELFFMVPHMIRNSYVDEPHFSLCCGACFHWVGMMLHSEHPVASWSSRVTDIVWLLSSIGFGSTRVGLVFPTLVFLVAHRDGDTKRESERQRQNCITKTTRFITMVLNEPLYI